MVLGRRPAEKRPLGQGCAEPFDRAPDGRARGVRVRDRLDQGEAVPSWLGWRDAGDAGIARGDGA
jgi:hypothetical protein